MSRPQVFIMLKEPRPGRVKTRLGRDLGLINATWWFRHQSARMIRQLAGDVRWKTVLAVAPDTTGMQSRVWPASLQRWAQGKGDLGARMLRIFRHAPKGPVVIIGADIPDVTPALIAKAFRALGENDAVFGPAPDGGYWLIGLKRGAKPVPKNLFANVRWSSEHALADTRASLGSAKVALIDCLQDVDHASDLVKIKRN